jgi:hypothetical protein
MYTIQPKVPRDFEWISFGNNRSGKFYDVWWGGKLLSINMK